MIQPKASADRRAFALAELGAIVAVALGVFAVAAVLGSESRRQARLGDDVAKLRRFGEATVAYAADNSDLYWTFSWKKGYNLSPYPDLNAQAQSSDPQAASAQAVYLLRTKAGREDIIPIFGWLPHLYYSHFALLAHLGSPWPDLWAVSSADKRRIAWARNPRGFDAGLYLPAPTPIGTNNLKRWPYSSNFITSTAFYDGSQPADRLYQHFAHNQYYVPALAALGARTLSEVAFPSMKVQLHDQHARHFSGPRRQPYCTHDQARLPILFADAHVAVRGASESNPGWVPPNPAGPEPTQFSYAPAPWEPPTMSGTATDPVIGRFRWTRGTVTQGGLAGRDFGGPETCSGQPGCP